MVATPQDQLFNGTFSTTAVVVAIFIALSLYNASELTLLVFFTFKKWRGMYFWSLIAAGVSIIVYSIGFMTTYYYHGGPAGLAGSIINNIGWITMVCSQSVVLYSRIHLVLYNQRVLHAILIIIIVNGAVLYIPTTILAFASYATHSPTFQDGGYVVEKIQMTAFSIQEFAISGLYIRQIFRLSKITFDQDKQRKIAHLFTVHAVIICLDVGLLVLEYLDYLVYQQAFKSVAYSMKLKMEFAVLGDLIESVRRSGSHDNVSQHGSSNGRKSTGAAPPKSPAANVDRCSSSEELVPIPKRDSRGV